MVVGCSDGAWRGLGWMVLLVVLLAVLAAPAVAQGRSPGLIKLEGRHVKWGPLAYGTGAEVTYKLLRQPHDDPAARNCRRMLPLGEMLGRAGVSGAAFAAELRQALALWSAVADIRFREVAALDAADIVIGTQAEPRGIAYANVTLGEAPVNRIAGLARAAICFNPEMSWTTLRDNDPTTFHIRRVLAHELGHAIGLDHLGPEGGIMGFRYVEADDLPVAALSAADVTAVSRLYGALDAPAVTAVAAGPKPAARLDPHQPASARRPHEAASLTRHLP